MKLKRGKGAGVNSRDNWSDGLPCSDFRALSSRRSGFPNEYFDENGHRVETTNESPIAFISDSSLMCLLYSTNHFLLTTVLGLLYSTALLAAAAAAARHLGSRRADTEQHEESDAQADLVKVRVRVRARVQG